MLMPPDSSSSQLRILLAEDHAIVREGIASLLRQDENFQVIAEVEDGRSAVQMAGEFQPDIILMDLSMPNINGTEAIKEIKHRYPQIHIIVLTIHNSEEYIRATLRAGANGYVLKDDTSEELLSAIHSVAAGKTYLTPSICSNVIVDFLKGGKEGDKSYSWEHLSHREREVLKLVAEGERNRDIAKYLSLSEKTVEKHRSNLMKKLGLHSAAQITTYAIRNGLINIS
ncbi:MAG: response regulator transcription factor [Pseudomonadota bacterium]